jgi:HEAT repeat protein
MSRHLLFPLFAAALLVITAPARADDADTLAADELLLKGAGLPTDGPGLLAFFRQRSRGEADGARLAALVARLGSDKGAERQKACAELVAVGPAALPLLRQAANDPDAPAAAALARRCLRALEVNSAALTAAAVRLLARHRPAGTAEALLEFLPNAEDAAVLDEARAALAAVSYRDGKPEPALLRALDDKLALRRAAAVAALCRHGTRGHRAALGKLLADPVPSVRLRAALALAQASNAEAVSALIALLPELPVEQAREALEFLSELAADQGPKEVLGEDGPSRRRCRDAWAAWWLASAKPGLVDEVRKRTLTEADRAKVQGLIDKLGDDGFDVRQQAEADLKKMGVRALPLLRPAARSPDVEVRQRVEACVKAIEGDEATPLSPVTVRLIALRQPAGAAEALLAFLPFAEDDTLAAEVQAALNAVTWAAGKADPAVLGALEDKSAVRRAAAAEALGQGPTGDHLDAVRKLLTDKDAPVRLKAALALAGRRERAAVPVLIALVGELPPEQAGPAEEYLRRLAEDRPPELPAGDEPGPRKKRCDAWAAWWAAHGARVELVERQAPVVVERYRGYTLLVQPQTGQVSEVGPGGKTRWVLNGLLQPQDAQVLPGERVLVAEYGGQRVTERNLKGDVLWKKQLTSWPLSAERLANGHTFIVCRNQLLEVDRSGRELLAIPRPNDVLTARKLRDGQIVCVLSNRTVLRLDRAGKEVKSFLLPNVFTNGNEILPNGHVLVPASWQNRVAEYDTSGKEVWQASVMQALCAHRLPNGNTLVASQQQPMRVVELDRKGKEVWQHPTNNYVSRTRRR